jgi:hypothetical protein
MLGVMLYEAAQILLMRSTKWSWFKAWAMQIARRRGIKKAIVAQADLHGRAIRLLFLAFDTAFVRVFCALPSPAAFHGPRAASYPGRRVFLEDHAAAALISAAPNTGARCQGITAIPRFDRSVTWALRPLLRLPCLLLGHEDSHAKL